MTSARRRDAVAHLMRKFKVSERRACALVGQRRSTNRYVPAPGDFEVVRVTPREIFHVTYRKADGRFTADTQNVIWKPFGKRILWTNRNWNTIVRAVAL